MEPKQSKENALFEWYDSLVFALAVIVLFFVFAVRIITVSGVSMQPTLYGGDRVAVQSMLYTPQRGDVVVVEATSITETRWSSASSLWAAILLISISRQAL